jgi:hypothetical protein
MQNITDQDLLAYLDEQLPVARMTEIEKTLRTSTALRVRASALAQRRDQGMHSVGECWRRLRLSCPTRSQLGSFVLGTLEPELADYINFHLRTVGCRYCDANLSDLRSATEAAPEASRRRQKIFQSSAGFFSGTKW